MKNIRAVSIGISRYSHLTQLSCASRDALDIATVLREGAVSAEVETLIDVTATRTGVLRALDRLADAVNSEDTAVVFFSGHGGRAPLGTGYLCTVEATASNLKETHISSDELTRALRTIRSERLVVLLDTCYSGAIGEARHRSELGQASLCAKTLSGLIEGRGRVILAASRPEEMAWEMPRMNNGVFTTHLLAALRGATSRPDGTIWMSDVFSYVSREVRRHGRQHPFQKAIGEDFVLLVRGRDMKQVSQLHPIRTKLDQTTLRRMMHSAYNRPELSLICRDFGLSLEDLPGTTLETQMMDLIDHCYRRGLADQLVERMRLDRPQLQFTGVLGPGSTS